MFLFCLCLSVDVVGGAVSCKGGAHASFQPCQHELWCVLSFFRPCQISMYAFVCSGMTMKCLRFCWRDGDREELEKRKRGADVRRSPLRSPGPRPTGSGLKCGGRPIIMQASPLHRRDVIHEVSNNCPGPAPSGGTGSCLFLHCHHYRYPDTRPDHLLSTGHARVWCRRLDFYEKEEETNWKSGADRLPRFSGLPLALSLGFPLAPCHLAAGTTMASLQKTLFSSASRTASSRLQFATRRRTLPISIPRILQVRPSARFASTMAPKVRFLPKTFLSYPSPN